MDPVTPFTASNGVSIQMVTPVTDRGAWMVLDGERVSPNDVQALREFFRTEEDERLGRWRWPENQNYTVYAETTGTDWVRVWSESNALLVRMDRKKACENYVDRTVYENAARAYFAAHPVPKPAWHGAANGEIWAITLNGEPRIVRAEVATFRESGYPIVFLPVDKSGETWTVSTSPVITSGRRIWPEEVSS